jgi:hypothetical protein
VTTYFYDGNGCITRAIDVPGQTTSITYEVIDGVVRRVDPPDPCPAPEEPPDEPFVVG